MADDTKIQEIKDAVASLNKTRETDYDLQDHENEALNVKRMIEEAGYEYCGHTLAFFGSSVDQAKLNKKLKRPLTQDDASRLDSDQYANFENLKEFPFQV